MLFDQIKCSLRNLGRKKFRSVLTIASIAIGVASVILIASIGEIGKQTINAELDSLGVSGIAVSANKKVEGASLQQSDLELIRTVEGVEEAIPIVVSYAETRLRNLVADCVIWGIDAGAQQVISLETLYGREINRNDIASSAQVCVVDEKVATSFYKRENIVGKKAKILLDGQYQEFEIIGVASSNSNMFKSLVGEIVPSFVYLPYTTMQRLAAKDSFDQVAVKIANQEVDTEAVSQAMKTVLNRAYGTEDAFEVQNIAQQKDRLNGLLDIVTWILSAIAAISLVVAGLGILTVMLVSVNERTREIGIKKSIGASKHSILIEFLIEAFTISLIGSILGTGIGTLLVLSGCMLIGIAPQISLGIIAFCIGFALLIGVICGVYPAMLAAKLRPVDALRFE